MRKATLLICVFFTFFCSAQSSKAKISLVRVNHYVRSLDSICSKEGKKKVNLSLKKAVLNYYSPSNVTALHTIKIRYKSSNRCKTDIYKYMKNVVRIYSVNEEQVLVSWKVLHAGVTERSKMVRLNDSTLVWSYQKGNGETVIFNETSLSSRK